MKITPWLGGKGGGTENKYRSVSIPLSEVLPAPK